MPFLPAGNSRYEPYHRIVPHRRLRTLQEPDITLSDKHVHGGAHTAPLVIDPRSQRRIPVGQAVQYLPDGFTAYLQVSPVLRESQKS